MVRATATAARFGAITCPVPEPAAAPARWRCAQLVFVQKSAREQGTNRKSRFADASAAPAVSDFVLDRVSENEGKVVGGDGGTARIEDQAQVCACARGDDNLRAQHSLGCGSPLTPADTGDARASASPRRPPRSRNSRSAWGGRRDHVAARGSATTAADFTAAAAADTTAGDAGAGGVSGCRGGTTRGGHDAPDDGPRLNDAALKAARATFRAIPPAAAHPRVERRRRRGARADGRVAQELRALDPGAHRRAREELVGRALAVVAFRLPRGERVHLPVVAAFSPDHMDSAASATRATDAASSRRTASASAGEFLDLVEADAAMRASKGGGNGRARQHAAEPSSGDLSEFNPACLSLRSLVSRLAAHTHTHTHTSWAAPAVKVTRAALRLAGLDYCRMP